MLIRVVMSCASRVGMNLAGVRCTRNGPDGLIAEANRVYLVTSRAMSVRVVDRPLVDFSLYFFVVYRVAR